MSEILSNVRVFHRKTEIWHEEDAEKPIWPFLIENITVVQAPLLKIYYWESFNIDGLNAKLTSGEEYLEHDIFIPTAQINSCQLKIVFWIRDTSATGLEMRLKRIQNCDCKTFNTRVGFNQYRKLYHCPHRHLVNINQEIYKTKPDDLVAMSVVAYFYFLGSHKLTYELRCVDKYVLLLNFFVDIVCFEPQKCLLTKELIPVDMSESRRFVQALWIRNITMQDLNFTFTSKTRGLKVINSSLNVPRQSVWPLMVEYRPTDFQNELDLVQTFDGIRLNQKIRAKGFIEQDKPECNLPVTDYNCGLHRFIIHPSILEFQAEVDEERSLMVCIHNYAQHCVEFHWQNYVINNLFGIHYEPEVFRLKPHHSKLCVVQLRSYDRPLHFKRVPLVLEVHRVFDRNTKIAKSLLTEIESIDDQNLKQGSYMEHVYLQLNIKVNFKPKPVLDLKYDTTAPLPNSPWICELPTVRTSPITIFEKLFWEFLSHSNFMRGNKNPEISDELNYHQVLDLYSNPPCRKQTLDLNANTVLKLVSLLIADGIRQLSKSWIFVPPDSYERPL